MNLRFVKRALVMLAIFGTWSAYAVVAFNWLPEAPHDAALFKHFCSGLIGGVATALTGAALRGLWELSGEILNWMEKQK